MAKSSSGIKSKKNLKNSIQNMNKTLNELGKELETLSTALTAMMKGNTDGPYWNGSKAKTFYTKAKKNLDNDIADYKKSYDVLSSLAVKYEQAVQKD